ncbi:carbon-nitrogen hydrolase family protein [Actinoplanes xinjiangensis]|uniref:carbon-nitrogen hydrolase family protein n=1 Tax=Actinoplanes xinjiangensis TaxID=512350 RepID=UPI00344810FC
MVFRIAITQPSASADVRRNGRAVRNLMRQAADQDVRLVHFPEGHLSGYAKEQVGDWAQVDWDAARNELRQILQLAAQLRLWVVLGSAHPLTWPNRPHNSLYVISDEGRIVDRYDKRFCSNTEITSFYTPGTTPGVFDVDGFRSAWPYVSRSTSRCCSTSTNNAAWSACCCRRTRSMRSSR